MIREQQPDLQQWQREVILAACPMTRNISISEIQLRTGMDINSIKRFLESSSRKAGNRS